MVTTDFQMSEPLRAEYELALQEGFLNNHSFRLMDCTASVTLFQPVSSKVLPILVQEYQHTRLCDAVIEFCGTEGSDSRPDRSRKTDKQFGE